MVEKNKKILRVFFCFLFAVILPFSFAGCKKEKSEEGNVGPKPEINAPSEEDNNNNNDDNQSQEGDLNESVYTVSEAVGFFNSTYSLMDDYLEKINSFSSELETNDYSREIGEETATNIFSYSYYPYHLVSSLNSYCEKSQNNCLLELNKIYCYQTNTIEYNFINLSCTSKDNLILYIINCVREEFSFYSFKLNLDNNVVKSLNLSMLTSDGKNLIFTDACLDFANYDLTACYGKIADTTLTTKEFFNRFFTTDNILTISEDRWSTRFYEKFTFADNNFNYEECCDGENALNKIKNNFDSFGFLEAYDIKDEFEKAGDIIYLDLNLFGSVDGGQTKISYNSNNYKFVKSS